MLTYYHLFESGSKAHKTKLLLGYYNDLHAGRIGLLQVRETAAAMHFLSSAQNDDRTLLS